MRTLKVNVLKVPSHMTVGCICICTIGYLVNVAELHGYFRI